LSIALEYYGRQSKDRDRERWSATIKLRATRRLGEISAALPKRQNRHGKLPTDGSFKTEVLAQAGITTQDASRAEQVAAIPETEFEEVLATKEAKQEPVSAHDVTAKVKRKRKEKKREKRRTAIRGRSHWLCSCGKNRSVGTIGANAYEYGEEQGNEGPICWQFQSRTANG